MAIGRINATLTGVQPGGLAKIVPTSVAVGSGSGSVDSNGNVTFSGASSVSINGCFTSSYDNYVIQLTQTAVTGDGETSFRMRVSGSDNSSSIYQWAGYYNRWNSSTLSANYASTTQTRYPIIGYTSDSYNDGIAYMEIYSPFLSQKTMGFNRIFSHDGAQYVVHNGFNIDVTTSFDGFTVYRADTITGNIRVYGYNQ